MTRKHFEWAVEFIASNYPPGHEGRHEAITLCLEMFSHFNDRFNEAKFFDKLHRLDLVREDLKQGLTQEQARKNWVWV